MSIFYTTVFAFCAKKYTNIILTEWRRECIIGWGVKMKKTIKRIALGLVSLILAAVIAGGCIVFGYYPHYRSMKKQYDVSGALTADKDEIRVMSCNLRCINPLDTGKKSWFYRADLIMKNIENAAPGIIGFQEATKWQYKYLTESLPGYDSVITYRDKAVNSEGCPVFYNTELYSLIDKGSFWLSETPGKMSRDWGAACYRICSYTILKAKDTGFELIVFNTHLDHVSEEARINGIKLVLEKAKEYGDRPLVLMGDLNAGVDTPTYAAATEIFDDAALMTQDTDTESCTYQGFGAYLDRGRIDYFMISKQGLEVLKYNVIKDTYDGVYPSDHFPVFTVLKAVNE